MRLQTPLVFLSGGLAAAIAAIGSFACQSYPPDHFPCGERTIAGEKVLTCDGKDEVCICNLNRCAQRDSDCPETNLRYSFHMEGDREDHCVEADDAKTVIDQLALVEDQRACPATLAPECGQANADGQPLVCGQDKACSCTEFRCAQKHGSCEQGWRWASTGVCLTSDARASLEASQPNIITGLCDGATFPEMCGTPGLGGTPFGCPTGTTCICQTNECGIKTPVTMECPSGYAKASDYEPGVDPVCIEVVDPVFPDPETGFCPGWE